MTEHKGLGRIYIPDERDQQYPLKTMLPKKAAKITRRMWRSSTYWGDQGESSSCVGFSWVHYLHHGPVGYPGKNPILDPFRLYKEAQKVDEWPGEEPAYEGTTIRAGADILLKSGYISEYRWGKTLDELIQAILLVGPCVVGTDWLGAMFHPDANGFIRAIGWPAGGHAYLVDGVDTKKEFFRIKNSWGRGWGKKGNAFISFDDMAYLIRQPHAEICLAKEVRLTEHTTVF